MGTLIRQLKFAKKITDYDVISYGTYHNPDMENNTAQQLILKAANFTDHSDSPDNEFICQSVS